MKDEDYIARAMFEADNPGKEWSEVSETMRSFYIAAARRWLAAYRAWES